MKKKLFLAFAFIPFLVFSQEYTETELVVLDLLTLSKKFATPGAEATMHQSSAGWYTSAKQKELWEIDISIHGNLLFIPEKKGTTRISNSEFHNLSIRGGAESATIPTALGGDTDVFYEGTMMGAEFEFQSLEGIGKKSVFYPFLQASVGLPLGTNIVLRYLPLTKIEGVEYKVAGVGLQHNFNQHFGENNQNGIQVAGLIAYSQVGVFHLFKPIELPGVALNKIKINGNLWEFQLLGSKDLNQYFEVFSAVGLTMGSFNYQIGGEGEAFLNALNNAYKRLNASEQTFKFEAGFNVNFKKFTFNSVFSAGDFFNYNIGIHYKI
ncbi:MAG TPA: DUF6588 family protein [Salinimicrobium sp.]|nr:DUF6588 family protein [Salinimicrobium sp.]